MRIRHVAERAGLSIDAIRFYEKQGLLDRDHIQRSPNGYRDYSEQAIERLRMIRQAQTAGFTLAEIQELLILWGTDQLSDDLIAARLREKQLQIAAKIAELTQIERHIAEKLDRYTQTCAAPKRVL